MVWKTGLYVALKLWMFPSDVSELVQTTKLTEALCRVQWIRFSWDPLVLGQEVFFLQTTVQCEAPKI